MECRSDFVFTLSSLFDITPYDSPKLTETKTTLT